MAVNYKMYQDNRKESKTKGKWFARAIHNGVAETNDLAAVIERNCSMKKSDVQAVLTELTEVMTDMLQRSIRVKLNGLGSFKIGISTRAAESVKEFSLEKNLKNVHVLFQPEVKVDRSNKARTKALLSGMELREATKRDGTKGNKTTTTKPGSTPGSTEEGGN